MTNMMLTSTVLLAFIGACVDGKVEQGTGWSFVASSQDQQELANPASVSDFVEPRGHCPVPGRPHSIRNDVYGPAVNVCPIASERRGRCKVLSFGIDYNFAVDNYFLNEMGCEVWSFDPSMKKDPSGKDYKQGPNHRFFYKGIGDHDGDHKGTSTVPLWAGGKQHYDVRSLPSIMAEMAVDFVDVVRMDTEGAEFEVIKSWKQAGLLPKIGQLLMEVHGMKKKERSEFQRFADIKCRDSELNKQHCFDALPYSEVNTHEADHGTWEVTLTHSTQDVAQEAGGGNSPELGKLHTVSALRSASSLDLDANGRFVRSRVRLRRDHQDHPVP